MNVVVPKLEISPINIDFLDYLASEELVELQTEGEANCPWGEIPPVFEFTCDQLVKLMSAVTLPAYYDLRPLGRVPEVKNQRPLHYCWAFAAYGSLESCLLPVETTDFSENNMVNLHGFDYGPNKGGNYLMAAAYLTRWSGPVKEEDDPYTGEIHPSPEGLKSQKHVQEIIVFPKWENKWGPGTEGHETLKQALMDYGAIDTSIHWGQEHYNENTFSYYCGSLGSKNHAVCIVGWDDKFDKQNFAPSIPPGNGAYIIRNSWGSDWGDQGYFYISYYDPNVLPRSIFVNAEDTGKYKRVYQYDPFGLVTTAQIKKVPTIWAANIFQSDANELLAAVSFYTFYPNTEYEVRIYTGGETGPIDGFLTSIMSGTIMLPGYHTVTLSTPVSLVPGSRFTAVTRLNSKRGVALAAIQKKVRRYTSNSSVNPGKSYASVDGFNWVDLYDLERGTACIKAFSREQISNADLSLTMTCNRTVLIGNPVTYTIKVTNNGPDNVTGLTLIDYLPKDVILNSVTPEAGTFEIYDRIVDFKLGSLASGVSVIVTIEVTPVTEGKLTNTASVTANEYDPNPDNNKVAQSTTVTRPDVIVSGNIRNSEGTKASVTMEVTCNGVVCAGNLSGCINHKKDGKILKYTFNSSHANSIKTYKKGKYCSLQASFSDVIVNELTNGDAVIGCIATITATARNSEEWSGVYEIIYPDGRKLKILGVHYGSLIVNRQVSQ